MMDASKSVARAFVLSNWHRLARQIRKNTDPHRLAQKTRQQRTQYHESMSVSHALKGTTRQKAEYKQKTPQFSPCNPSPPRATTTPMAFSPKKLAPPPLALLAALALLLLAACTNTKDATIARLSQQQIQQHFQQGTTALRNKKYKQAIQNLKVIAHDHPYSELAPRAQILLAFAHYRKKQKVEALVEVESFLQAYPSSPSLAYALYLKGLVYFQNVQHVERTQVDMTQAGEAFQILINKFPSSPYAHDAKTKLNLVQTQLVAHNIQAARFYLRNKNPLAAAQQILEALAEYPTTLYTPEMLYRLVEASLSLGLVEEARIWQDFLNINYRESRWTKKATRKMTQSQTNKKTQILLKIPNNAPSPAALPPKQTPQP